MFYKYPKINLKKKIVGSPAVFTISGTVVDNDGYLSGLTSVFDLFIGAVNASPYITIGPDPNPWIITGLVNGIYTLTPFGQEIDSETYSVSISPNPITISGSNITNVVVTVTPFSNPAPEQEGSPR